MDHSPCPYEALSWNVLPDDRQAAVEALLAQPDRIDVAQLVQPPGRKDLWEGSVAVLAALDWGRVAPHLPGLLEWLQDMNWPGAPAIFRLLADLEDEELASALQEAMTRARSEGDEDWLGNLKAAGAGTGGLSPAVGGVDGPALSEACDRRAPGGGLKPALQGPGLCR